MSIITIFQRKFSYSFLALLSLLFIVSISFGTINSSASADGSRKIQEEKSSFIDLQNNQAVKSFSETRRFSFLSNNIKNFFNGNDVGQTSAANNIVNGLSYSALSPDSIFTVNNNGDTNDLAPGDGICSDSSGNCTLRAAIQQANATTGTDEIVFNLTTPTTIQLNSTGGLLISEPLTITGPGARLLTVNGNSNTVTGIFKISYAAATTTTISGLTVNGSDGNGINNEARLNLRDVTVKGNRYGIYNTGRLDLNRLTVNNNSSGGIYIGSASVVNIYNTIITNNTSTEHGGGIHSLSSDVTLNNVTISHNTASTSGGGIYYSGQTSGIYVRNTIIANNTAPATTGPDVYSFNSANGAVFTSRGNNLIGKSVGVTGFVHAVNSDKVGTVAAPIDPMLGALQNNGGQTDTRTLLSGSPAKDAGNMCVTNSNCGGVNPPTALLLTDQRGTDFPRNYESGVDIGAFESFYPVPSITALSPNNWGTGRGAFELIVTGSNFVAGSIVKWNGQDKVTTFVSNTQLKAQILASDVQTAGQYSITVSNPQPSAAPSEPVSFTVSDCSFSLNPTSQTFTAAGGNGTVNVTTVNGCTWSVLSTAQWITISPIVPPNGKGPGTFSFSVAANNGGARTAEIRVNGLTFNVFQDGGCTYTLSSSTFDAPVGGTDGSVNIIAQAGCPWTAATNSSWITITSGAGGTGNGTITFTVAANTGLARSGTITAGGQTFTINQAPGCTFSLSPTSANPPSGGGTSTFNINAGAGCQWTAASNASWITITSGSNGSGNGTVTYSVAANAGDSRTGTITAGGQTFTVTQAPGCTYSISSVSATSPASGLAGSVNVTASTGCAWTAVSNASWITVTSGASGSGNGTVQFTVAANTGQARTGTITIAGQTFTINQDGGCVFTLSPTSANPPSGGGTSSFNVNAGAGCTWSAQSNDPWITITSGSNGSGNGSVTYSVAANTGAVRTGTITAGGQTFTVTQAAGCAYSLSSVSAASPSSGLAGSVNVTANTGCSWTAVSNDTWITITSGANGSGSGTVAFTVAANTGPARTGTITIAGQTFTVNQESGCVYTLSSTSTNVSSGSSTNSFNISSGVGCGWTAVSNASWITVTSNASGSGNGTIQFTVVANTGLERTGTITIAGQTFTVNQANGCTFIISPLNQSFSAAAGSGSFAITASNSACTWTAASNASWITVNTTSGTGNGTVAFTFAANTGLARTGNITAGGQTFTVNQATGCTITLTPNSVSFDAVMSSGSFNVTTSNTACTWTATATQPWITINNGTGTGNGIVTFTVQANVSPARTGTITVGDQTFTINQSNGCVYTLSPTSANVPSGSSTNSFNISSGAGCQWTAVSNISWITITSGGSGTGSSVISYTVAANVGPARQGTITAGGQTFTVTQANGCVFTLSSTSANSPSNGLTGSVNVTAIEGCAWTVASNDTWITIISGANGNGNGTAAYTVAANTGPARIGTITIAGQTFTVNQANGCVYNLITTSTNINESGGTANFVISSGAGCQWTAVSNEPWITITSGASGSGVGTVEFSVQSNLGGVDRTGTITAANGQTFTVRQISLTVRNFNDSGLGSLRQAVINANNSPGNDVITFLLPSPGIIKLTSGEITITDNGTLEIRGPGNEIVHISGENNSRILYVNRATVTISGVTLTKGNGVGVDSLSNYKIGGAVYVKQGALVLNRVHLSRNIISVPNATENRSIGGGVYYNGGADHQIKNSTFSENRCMYGGGYYSQGNVAIENSTFSLNTAEKQGGGIYSVGDAVLRNVTITANSSDGTNNSGAGIIIEAGRLNPANTIISGNNGPEITFTAGQFLSEGNNLIGDSPGDSTNTDKPLAYQPSDILDTPPMLSPLGLYGGTMPTEALLVNSPAINSGNNANAPPIQTDQRGAPRVMSGVIDIGAFEHNIGISPSGPGLPNGTIGGYYSQELKASRIDGTDPFEPFKYLPIHGFLPGGLQLSQEGHIYGYPTTAGVYTFIVRVFGKEDLKEMSGVIKYTIAVGCTYSINPTSRSINSAGENGTVNLTTLAGCTWTAQSNVPWITVTNNPANPRVGSGAVTYTVQPNTSVSRSGTITIGGQTFTVTQANGCVYSLSSNSVNAPAAGGTGSFNINSGTDCPCTAVSNASWITVTGGNTGAGNTVVNFSMQANTGVARTGTITAGGQTYTINQAAGNVPEPTSALFDFDGDGKTDISIFRPSVGEWWYLKSSSGSNGAFQFGTSTDKIVPADYTGDGKTDIAFFRPSTGVWFVLRSEDNSFYSFPFGASGDVPAPADYDGDGKADAAVFRPSNLTWYILRSSGGVTIQEFGVAGDVPTVSDYDGDGRADIAIYRPNAGQWWLLRSSLGIIAYQFGASADKPVQGDYTGDGKTDVAFYRPSSGEWFILRSENESFYSFPFGASGDVPSPGDYDGDGKVDAAVFRPSSNTWFAQRSTSGTLIQGFGIAGDVSVPNAFVP